MDSKPTPPESLNTLEQVTYLSSVPIRRIGKDGLPDSIASGALIRYDEKNLLLTVAHATSKPGKWAIELEYLPSEQRVKLWSLGTMNFLQFFETGSNARTLDFSYVTIPDDLVAYRQAIDDKSFQVTGQKPITVHVIDSPAFPSKDGIYGFCGTVLPELEQHLDVNLFSSVMKNYTGLTYSRTDGDFHVFILPTKHEGHDAFRGCSGAPVVDKLGHVVGLVCHGVENANEIWAFNFAPYLPVLALD